MKRASLQFSPTGSTLHSLMEILGQPWYVQLIGLTISLIGLYFVVTGIWMKIEEYRPMVEALTEAMLQSKHGSDH